MARPYPTIVPFKRVNPDYSSEKQREMKDRIRAQCRAIFSEHLVRIHHEYFNRLDDELFSLSDKAENCSLQTIYFEAMRFIRRERGGIENSLLDVLVQRYDEFWEQDLEESSEDPVAEFDEDNFSLVENEVLEEDLAISTMIDKLSQLLHTELYGLNRRFAAVRGKVEMDGRLNPVGPSRICHGFEQVIKPLLLDLKIKLLIYKFYEKHMASALQQVYKEINARLVEENVLPKLSHKIRHPDTPSAGVTASHSENRFPESGANTYAEEGMNVSESAPAPGLRAFEELHSLLDGWRIRNGLTTFSERGYAGPISAPVYPTTEVLNGLSDLQMHEMQAGVRAAHDVKSALVKRLTLASSDKKARPLAAPEEDVIDMVGMLFDFILGDEHLPDRVKTLIGRLQIPVIKVAILEKGFFSRKSHPVRDLLNKMAKVGLRLDGQSLAKSPLFTEMESIVDSILTRFDHNVEVFSEAMQRLNVYLEKEEQRSRVIEERTIQVTESKEQVELAKTKIGYALIRCMQGKEVPMFLRNFLNDAWKHVLLLTYLRRNKSIGEWEGALGVVSRLVWTITPVDDLEGKRKILKELPKLEQDIRIGLGSISFDAHKTTNFFKQLEACQMQALNQSSEDAANRSEESDPGKFEAAPGPVTPASGRDLAAEIDALMERVSEVDRSLFNDLEQGAERLSPDDGAGKSQPETAADDESSDDPFVQRVRDMEVGRWLTFRDDSNAIMKAKLSWKSPITAHYVFVNTLGAKIAEMSVDELVEGMREGRVKTIEDPSLPVVDRALDAMMKSLENLDQASSGAV